MARSIAIVLVHILLACICASGASFQERQFVAQVRSPGEILEALTKRVTHVVLTEHIDLRSTPSTGTRNGAVKLSITEETLSVSGRCTGPPRDEPELLGFKDGQCVLYSDTAVFLFPTVGAKMWLDNIMIRCLRDEPEFGLRMSVLMMVTADIRVFVTDVTIQGDGGNVTASGVSKGRVLFEDCRFHRLQWIGAPTVRVFNDFDTPDVITTAVFTRCVFSQNEALGGGDPLRRGIVGLDSDGGQPVDALLQDCSFVDNIGTDVSAHGTSRPWSTPTRLAFANTTYNESSLVPGGVPLAADMPDSVRALMLTLQDEAFLEIKQARDEALTSSGVIGPSTLLLVGCILAGAVLLLCCATLAVYLVYHRRRSKEPLAAKDNKAPSDVGASTLEFDAWDGGLARRKPAGKTSLASRSDMSDANYDSERDHWLPDQASPSSSRTRSTATPALGASPLRTLLAHTSEDDTYHAATTSTLPTRRRCESIPEDTPDAQFMLPSDFSTINDPARRGARALVGTSGSTAGAHSSPAPRAGQSYDPFLDSEGRSSAAATGASTPASMLFDREELESVLDDMHQRGQRFLGKYAVHDSTGRRAGGQGLVQFVQRVRDDAEFAVKFFFSAAGYQQEVALYSESKLQGLLLQPRFFSSNETQEHVTEAGYVFPPLIMTERGEALNEWVSRMAPDLPGTLFVLLHVAEKLQQLHAQGVCHRDLKPANILWLPSSNAWMLMDFGCAAPIGEDAPLAYSLSYAAPETMAAAARGDHSVCADAAADMWALGVIAFELLTGGRAFPPATARGGADAVQERLLGRAPLPWEDAERRRVLLPRLRLLKRSVLSCLDRDSSARPTSRELLGSWNGLFESVTGTTTAHYKLPEPAGAADAGDGRSNASCSVGRREGVGDSDGTTERDGSAL